MFIRRRKEDDATQVAQSEAQFWGLIGQHADASNGSAGITFTSIGLDADAGPKSRDGVWDD